MNNVRKRGWIDNKINNKRKFASQSTRVQETVDRGSSSSQLNDKLEGICHVSNSNKLPAVFGNDELWENFKKWILDSDKKLKSCLILGDSGIGKTSGANFFAQEAGFVRIELSNCDIKGPYKFSEDLREALSRKSLLGKISLIVEDIDGLEEEYIKILKGFIKNPGNNSNPLICTSGNILPSSLIDIKSYMNCLYMKPPEYAKIILYGRQKWPNLPYKVISTNANLCRGDIRQFNYLNQMETGSIKDVHLDKFTLAKKLLYSQETIQNAEKGVTIYENSMCNILHENYLYAIQNGRMIDIEKCAEHVDRLSDADMMRSGNTNSMLQESKLIFGAVAFGSGQKKANPTATLHFTKRNQQNFVDASKKSELQLALNNPSL